MLKKKTPFIFFIFIIIILFLAVPLTQAQTDSYSLLPNDTVGAYLYPLELKNGDIISDGANGRRFEIQSDTLFIWLDLMPEADFVHPTKYIFIRDNKIRPVLVSDGNWPPFLNGRMILYPNTNKCTLNSPYILNEIKVYLYPLELIGGNVISNGQQGPLYRIKSDTLYIWVDLMPTAFFAHPVLHIFISGDAERPVRVINGDWWPYLNGKAIFQVNKNLGGLISPFLLHRPIVNLATELLPE